MSDSEGSHKRGKREGLFCTEPKDTICGDCPGTQNYKDVCNPTSWSGHATFRRVVMRQEKNGGPFVMDKVYEAHHILCVSPVTKELLGNEDIRGSIEQTQWCINKKLNMKAMPLWGHTVKWYCSVNSSGGFLKSDVSAPPWENIPQHDIDHNSAEGYTKEVRDKMKSLARKVQDADHKLKGQSLADLLDDAARDFDAELAARGSRKEGTHNAWGLALQGDEEWAHPFSMASNGRVSNPAFPAKDFKGKLESWIDRLAKGIAGL